MPFADPFQPLREIRDIRLHAGKVHPNPIRRNAIDSREPHQFLVEPLREKIGLPRMHCPKPVPLVSNDGWRVGVMEVEHGLPLPRHHCEHFDRRERRLV